jgi:hypothetical protein
MPEFWNAGIPWPSACCDDDAIYLLEKTFFFPD